MGSSGRLSDRLRLRLVFLTGDGIYSPQKAQAPVAARRSATSSGLCMKTYEDTADAVPRDFAVLLATGDDICRLPLHKPEILIHGPMRIPASMDPAAVRYCWPRPPVKQLAEVSHAVRARGADSERCWRWARLYYMGSYPTTSWPSTKSGDVDPQKKLPALYRQRIH